MKATRWWAKDRTASSPPVSRRNRSAWTARSSYCWSKPSRPRSVSAKTLAGRPRPRWAEARGSRASTAPSASSWSRWRRTAAGVRSSRSPSAAAGEGPSARIGRATRCRVDRSSSNITTPVCRYWSERFKEGHPYLFRARVGGVRKAPGDPPHLSGDSLRFMVGSILGNRVRRVEDPELIDGRSTYVDDLRIPGTAHAVFVRSPLPHATITNLDTSNAEQAPGVLAVHTADTLGREFVPSFAQIHEAVGHGSLADGVVRYVGDPVALVVAETRAQAVDAAELVDVDYDLLDVVVDMEDALAPGAPQQFPAVGSNVAQSVRAIHPPDAGDVLADAEVVVRARIENQRLATAPLEGNAILVDPRPGADDPEIMLTAYVATQHPHLSRNLLAKYTGLDKEQFRVVTPHVGGAFGGKAGIGFHHGAIVAAARSLGRPVAWTET